MSGVSTYQSRCPQVLGAVKLLLCAMTLPSVSSSGFAKGTGGVAICVQKPGVTTLGPTTLGPTTPGAAASGAAASGVTTGDGAFWGVPAANRSCSCCCSASHAAGLDW